MNAKTLFSAAIILLSSFAAWAQQSAIKGYVTDKNTGEPLFGANVSILGTTIGYPVNKDGYFYIPNVDNDETVIGVSYTGYKTEQVTVNTKKSDDVVILLESLTHSLDEVVVTGTGTPHRLKDSPIQTEIINAKTVKTLHNPNLENVLMNISPSFSTQPNMMGSNLSMNGLANDYIVIMVDGQRLTGDFSGNIDFNRINLDNVERIEVVKGASSALYGSDAMGGVINIITKTPMHKAQISSTNLTSAHGEFSSSNNLFLNFGKIKSTSGFSKKSTDGYQLSPYEISGDELVETKKVAMYPQDDYSVSQKISYALSSKSEIYAEGGLYHRDLLRPIDHYDTDYRFDNHNYGGGVRYKLPKEQLLEASFASQTFSYSRVFIKESGDFKPGDEDLSKLQRYNNGKVQALLKPAKNHTIVVGSEWIENFMESPNLPKNSDEKTGTEKANEFGIWLQEEWRATDKLDVVGGVRHNYHQEYGHRSAPKFAIQYKPGPVRIRANVASGYKTPNLLQLYYSTITSRGVQTFGNTEMKPETGTYTGLSVEYAQKLFSASVTGYYNDIKNMIALITLEEPLTDEERAAGIRSKRRYTNLGSTFTRGVDFIFDARLGYGFYTGGGYSYTHARGRVANDEPFTPLEKISENAATFRLGWDKNFRRYLLNANVNGRFEDEKFYADGNAKAYQQWDINTSHRLTHNRNADFTIGFGVRNIFDETDNSPFGSNYATIDPGRRFYVSLKLDLKM